MKKISLKNKKVFIAGHTGLVGQSLCKRLENEKCKILFVNKKKLDLKDFNKTDRWLKLNKPDYIFIAAARVGGILENSSYPANFIYDNLKDFKYVDVEYDLYEYRRKNPRKRDPARRSESSPPLSSGTFFHNLPHEANPLIPALPSPRILRIHGSEAQYPPDHRG